MVDVGEVANRGEQIKLLQAEGTAHAVTQRLQNRGHDTFTAVEVMCCD